MPWVTRKHLAPPLAGAVPVTTVRRCCARENLARLGTPSLTLALPGRPLRPASPSPVPPGRDAGPGGRPGGSRRGCEGPSSG
ncbi:hypothetical protein AV530_002067 [Patagioenas fasciata monilis]|uniref:Uncharacterized protein n=1 Tax=Patagioenas fasciata monilis TaxID=372326 RepID=A0A1V4J6X5_PATFA|nr:hypothetical protein AV530_002067 [Patagioenas fasciata monilis]